MQGTNYNNKAPLTLFQYKRHHLEYSCYLSEKRPVLEPQVCSYCLNIGHDQLKVALTMHKLNIGKY